MRLQGGDEEGGLTDLVFTRLVCLFRALLLGKSNMMESGKGVDSIHCYRDFALRGIL